MYKRETGKCLPSFFLFFSSCVQLNNLEPSVSTPVRYYSVDARHNDVHTRYWNLFGVQHCCCSPRFFSIFFFSNFIRRSLHLLVGCCWPAPACPLVVSSFFFSFRQMNYKHRYKSQRETHARHPFLFSFSSFSLSLVRDIQNQTGAMGRQTPKASTFFLGFFFFRFLFCFIQTNIARVAFSVQRRNY